MSLLSFSTHNPSMTGSIRASSIDHLKTDAQISTAGSDYGRSFNHMLEHVNNTQLKANEKMVAAEANPERNNLIETVMAIQEANQTMNLMVQVRNRLVDGYQEIFSQQI